MLLNEGSVESNAEGRYTAKDLVQRQHLSGSQQNIIHFFFYNCIINSFALIPTEFHFLTA